MKNTALCVSAFDAFAGEFGDFVTRRRQTRTPQGQPPRGFLLRGMTTGGLPPQCSQETGMTLGYVIQTLQRELRKGMEHQQQRLSKETLNAIEKGLAPVHELIEKVENKATKGIQATLANAKGLSKGQEELERSIGHMTTGTAILRSRVFAIEEKIAELERHAGPGSLPAPSGRATLRHQAGTPHAPSSMSSCILAPCGVELPKSRWEELGVDPTTHGTVVIPTPTSGTWGSPGSMTSTKEGPRCRRCIQGPSWHGGHDRSDPACTLHGSKVRNGGEALAYLRRHQAAQSTPILPPGANRRPLPQGERQRRLQLDPPKER